MLEVEDLGIIADDLTGACDVAACFAAKLGSVEVMALGRFRFNRRMINLQVLNTQSRLRTVRQLGTFCRGERCSLQSGSFSRKSMPICAGRLGLNWWVCWKVSVARASRWTCVVAPAIPSIGRTTLSGVQYDRGIRIDQGACRAARTHRPVPQTSVWSSSKPAVGDCLLADAETQEDLERIVDTYLAKGRVVFVGSIGLAWRWPAGTTVFPAARRLGLPRVIPLFVCGSRHPRSRAQLERARCAGVQTLDFEPALLQL